MTATSNDRLAWVRRLSVLASALAGLLTYVTIALVINANHPRVARSYWISGDAAWKGLNPFAAHPGIWDYRNKDGVTVIVDTNLNPPTMLPLFQSMALVEMHLAAITWTIVSAALFYTACWALIRRYKPHPVAIPWLLLSPIFAENLILGQTYNLLFALGTAGWLLLDKRRDVAAGIFIGLLCAFKPNFGLWPLFLLLTNRWRPALSAGITAGAMFIASVLLYGVSGYRQWLAAVAMDNHFTIPTDASINGTAMRFGFEHGELVAILLAGVTAIWCWRKRLAEPSGPAIIVSILASPLAWAHYVLLAFPAFLARRWNPLTITCAVLLTVPPASIASSMLRPDAAWFGLYYPFALFLTLGALVRFQPRDRERSGGSGSLEETARSN